MVTLQAQRVHARKHTHTHTHTHPPLQPQLVCNLEAFDDGQFDCTARLPSDPSNTVTEAKMRSVSPQFMSFPEAAAAAADADADAAFIPLIGAAAQLLPPPPPPPPQPGGLVTEVASPFCFPFMARAQLPPKHQSQGQQQRQQQGEREQGQLSHPQGQLSQQGHQPFHQQGDQLSQQQGQVSPQQGQLLLQQGEEHKLLDAKGDSTHRQWPWPVSEECGGGGEGREDLSGRYGAMGCTQRSDDTVCCVRGC